jgi:hypothetical protein
VDAYTLSGRKREVGLRNDLGLLSKSTSRAPAGSSAIFRRLSPTWT